MASYGLLSVPPVSRFWRRLSVPLLSVCHPRYWWCLLAVRLHFLALRGHGTSRRFCPDRAARLRIPQADFGEVYLEVAHDLVYLLPLLCWLEHLHRIGLLQWKDLPQPRTRVAAGAKISGAPRRVKWKSRRQKVERSKVWIHALTTNSGYMRCPKVKYLITGSIMDDFNIVSSVNAA